MVIILLAWGYALLLSYTYGHAMLSIVKLLTGSSSRFNITIQVVAGFAGLNALTSALSLIMPIGLLANSLLFAGTLIYLAVRYDYLLRSLRLQIKEARAIPGSLYVLLALMCGMALALSAVPDAKYDEGLYYLQTIKWTEQYPAITGLGNLHAKLAFNSGWHMLAALFSFSFLELNLYTLNGLFLILVGIYALGGLRNLLQQQITFSNCFRITSLFPLYLMLENVLSPSPDFIIPFLIWIVFSLFIQKIEEHSLKQFDTKSMLILLFSVFAVTVKLSAAPVLLLPLFLQLLQPAHSFNRSLAAYLFLGLFLSLPWLSRNIINSGYLVYPFYQLDLFTVDWKVPAELVQLEVLETRSFAKVRQMLFTEVEQMSVSEWLPFWFRQLQRIEKAAVIVNLCLAVALPFYIMYLFYKRGSSSTLVGYTALLTTVYVGIFFWFFSAPHFRYGISFTVVLSLFFLAWLLLKLVSQRRWPFLAKNLLPLFLLLFMMRPLYLTGRYYFAHEQHFLVSPGQYPQYTLKVISVDGLRIHIPESSAQCWDAPLPCAPFFVDGLLLRNGKLEGGFRIESPDAASYSQKRLESMKVNGEEYNQIFYREKLP